VVRSYGQWCGVAKALDVVGERWTLLVIRELLEGPQRYTDLRNQIPGVATDVLAARLKDLEEAGVIMRQTLPPPAASKVYELTDLGRDLTPVVHALARWGMRLMDDRDDEVFQPHWLALALRGLIPPGLLADVRLDIDFALEGEDVVRISIEDGMLRYVPDPADEPDITVRAALGTLTHLADGSLAARDAMASGRLEITGSRDAVRAYGRLFPPAARSAGRA
jgi:DNA-binding HxlR family transcriptional regulator